MVCPFGATGQILGPRVGPGGRSPEANINTPIYAYLPAIKRIPKTPDRLNKFKVPFSAMRSEYVSDAIRNCPGAVNLDSDFPRSQATYMDSSTGGLPTLLGPIGSTASTWLVRNTQDISNAYNQKPPTPAGWNQCHIFDINSVVAGTPDRCNIMKDIGNDGVIRIQELEELIGRSNKVDPRCSQYPPLYPDSDNCNAIIGGPFTREGGASVYDPQAFIDQSQSSVVRVGFAVILYNADDGPPKELNFERVGTDSMSSTQKVSSRVIFTRFFDRVDTQYWDVQVQLSIQNRYSSAADALAGRYTTQKNFSYLWVPASPSLSFNHVNIQFSSLLTTIFDDQVAVTALATFVAIVTFAGTIWGKRDTVVDICQFVWKKYRKHRAPQDVPLK